RWRHTVSGGANRTGRTDTMEPVSSPSVPNDPWADRPRQQGLERPDGNAPLFFATICLDERGCNPQGGVSWIQRSRRCATRLGRIRNHSPLAPRGLLRDIGLREVGEGRFTRQPGQVRKEAALTGPSGFSSSLPPFIGTTVHRDLSDAGN